MATNPSSTKPCLPGTGPDQYRALAEAVTATDNDAPRLPPGREKGPGDEGPPGPPNVPPPQVQEGPSRAEKKEDELSPWCAALTKVGERCIAFPVGDSTFCAGHDAALRESASMPAAAAAAPPPNAAPKSVKTQDFIFESLTLADRASLQEAIDAVFRLEFTGKLPVTRGPPTRNSLPRVTSPLAAGHPEV